jgi:hypothetical protein
MPADEPPFDPPDDLDEFIAEQVAEDPEFAVAYEKRRREMEPPVRFPRHDHYGRADNCSIDCPAHPDRVRANEPPFNCAEESQGDLVADDIEPDDVRLQRFLVAWRDRWSVGPPRPLPEVNRG